VFRRSLVSTAVALAFAAVSANAYAKGCPGSQAPAGTSAAVAQYVEQINTATGSCATGYGKPHVKPLKPAIQRKLTREGGSDAKLLQQVATSTAYGAPQTTIEPSTSATSGSTPRPATKPKAKPRASKPKAAVRPRPVRLPKVRTDATPSKALSAAANVVTDGSDGRLIALAVVLVVITLAALGAATLRQRAHRD
jgi:hypothetical protein